MVACVLGAEKAGPFSKLKAVAILTHLSEIGALAIASKSK